jgi:hypothetical protein
MALLMVSSSGYVNFVKSNPIGYEKVVTTVPQVVITKNFADNATFYIDNITLNFII